MTLILVDTPPTIAARLRHMNITGHQLGAAAQPGWLPLANLTEAYALPSPRLWLLGGETPPALAVDAADLIIAAAQKAPSTQGQRLTLALQDSTFAPEHGFLLTVGGPTNLLVQAKYLLDALAPSAGAWLHAGGLAAPDFLRQVMAELGGGLGGLTSLVFSAPSAGLHPLWANHQALQRRLAALAESYLADNPDEQYESSQALPPLLALTPPNSRSSDSPARKLACLLVWLNQQSNQPSSNQ